MGSSYEDIVKRAVSGSAETTETSASAKSLDKALAGWDARASRLSDSYAAKERTAARDLAEQIALSYDASLAAAQDSATAKRRDLDTQLRADIDANAVEELVQRRQLEERLTNMGLLSSGYGTTNQVAVGLQKSNADAAARARRAAGGEDILRTLTTAERASAADKAKAEREVLYDAEKRVADYVATLEQQAGNAALSEYKASSDAALDSVAAAQKQRNYLTDLAMTAALSAQKDTQAAQSAAQDAQAAAQKDAQAAAAAELAAKTAMQKNVLSVSEHNVTVLKLAASVEDASLRKRILQELR